MTYGHEACVLRAISTFLHRELGVGWENTDTLPGASPNGSKVLLGSGASNLETEQILGTPGAPRFGNPACRLYYSIGQEPQILKRWQYGKFVTPYVHTICNPEGRPLLRPESKFGEQTDDYLLVTRIPGTLRGTVLTVFAGLHGPGTRSTEKLFSSLRFKDLTRLASGIGLEDGKVPYFQAVFRASRFQRNAPDDPTNSDVATELELVTEGCPPRPLVPA
jgi:hypothetical protein